MDEIQTNQRACVAAKLATLKNGYNQHTKEGSSNDLSSQSDAATLLNDRSGDQIEPRLSTAEVIAKETAGPDVRNAEARTRWTVTERDPSK